MAGNPHPVFQDGVPVDKANARAYLPLRLGNPDALRNLDGSAFWLCYVQTLLAFFYRDTGDTTSEDNGTSIIKDANGGIWKLISGGAGIAIGAAGPLAGRSAFDGEDPGFTYFGADTELIYIRLSAGGWSSGSSIKGPEGEPGTNGRNFEPDEVVPDLSGRDVFDGEAKNFAVLVEADSSNDDLPTMYFKQSAASGDWSSGFTFAGGPAPSVALRGYISGLALSNDPVTPATILIIAPGVATSDDNSESMAFAAAMSKTTASWAVGSGNGGLDAGSVAANTWYHAFLIMRPDTDVVDVLLSTSATAPTLPASYTKKRRIGAILTDASGNIIPFTQVGNEFLWKTVPPYVSAGSPPPAAVATAMALIVPTGVQVRARVSVYLNSNELVRRSVFLTSPDQVQSAALVGSKSSLIAGSNLSPGYPGPTQGTFYIRTNTSGQIYYELDGSSASTGLRFITEGWEEYL